MVRQSGTTPIPGELAVTGSGSSGGDVNLDEVGGVAITLGQKAMAASLPVVIASDQSAIPVTGSFSGTSDVNLLEVAGVATKTGHGTAADTLRVELPTDGTGVIAAVTAITNSVTVIQGTATNLKAQAEAYQGGSAVGAANPLQVSLANTGANATPVAVSLATAPTTTVNQGTSPWIVAGGGTAGSAATGVVTVQGIASMTPLLVTPASNSAVNVAQVGGTNTVTGGVNGTLGIGGSVATNVAIGTNPVNLGAQAVSSENSAVTATRMVQLVADLVGKLIVLPYANPENFVSGVISSAMTGTTTTSLVAAPAGSLRNYITSFIVSNGSTTVPTDILIQDGSGGTTLLVIPAPCGTGTGTGAAGAVVALPVPLRQPTAATALFAANVTTGSSTKISAVGYKGL